MPRVFHVTATKEMDFTILAESREEVLAALEKVEHEVDDWDPPDWDFSAYDPLGRTKKIPEKLFKFDMVVLEGEIRSAEETYMGADKKIAEMRDAAEKELEALRAEKAPLLPGG
jgi:hypothetical protein